MEKPVDKSTIGFRRIGPAEYNTVRFLMILDLYILGCKVYRNPIKSFNVLSSLLKNFRRMMGKSRLVRAFKTAGKYRWDIYNPPWPSKAFNSFFTNHLHEILPISNKHVSLRRLLIAITKRCPLQCEHCSEGDTLYNKDVLSYDEFIERIDPLVKDGVGQLVYSGGEPLSRFDDLLKFIEHYRDSCDQWIYTSAFGLTLEKARQLKNAGLNGAAISLDHHVKEEHNRFRGNKESYDWVLEGIKNLQRANVFVSLNICPTRKYVDSQRFDDFVSLAETLNIPIINIVEPRAVGNYHGMNVELEDHHKAYLMEVSNKYNYDKTYFQSPSVIYPASYRRTMPCGGGKSYLLLDYDGTLYPCPFCKVTMPSVKSNAALCEAV